MIKIIYHPSSTPGGIALILKNFILLPQYWEGATCIFAKYFNPLLLLQTRVDTNVWV